jgi:hypothetical protein
VGGAVKHGYPISDIRWKRCFTFSQQSLTINRLHDRKSQSTHIHAGHVVIINDIVIAPRHQKYQFQEEGVYLLEPFPSFVTMMLNSLQTPIDSNQGQALGY